MRAATWMLAAAMSVGLAGAGGAEAAGLWGATVAGVGSSSALAYNRDRGEFLAVWSGWDGSVLRVFGRRYRESGEPIGGAVALTSGNDNLVRVRVAYDHHVKRYLVTWCRGGTSGITTTLEGHLYDGLLVPQGSLLTLFTGEALDIAVVARNQREHSVDDAAFVVLWGTWGGPQMGRVRGNATLLPVVQVATGGGPWGVAAAYDPGRDRILLAWRDGTTLRARLAGSDGALQPEFTVASTGSCFGHAVAFDPASRRYLLAWGAPSPQNTCDVYGRLYSSEPASPIALGTTTLAAAAGATSSVNAIVAEPGTFVVALDEQSAALPAGQETLRLRRYRADALFINEHALGITGINDTVGLATGAHGATPVTYSTPWSPQTPTTIQFALFDRWFLRGVHGHGDADADGRSDLTTFQPGTSTLTTRTQFTTTPAIFAIPGAQPVLLDWDGDGRTDRAVWEPSTGKWWMLQSSDGTAASVHLGRAGDVPVPGDYLGLGRDQAAVFRPSTGEWFIRASSFGRPATVTLGQVGDMPVPADWDGDGDIEVGVWRPSTGIWTAAQPDGTAVGVPSTAWGGAGDFPFGGDVTGDARADQVVYRRQLGVAWVRDGATGAASTVTLGDGVLMPLDWDGNGKANLAVLDQESGVWRIRDGLLTTTVTFGGLGDIPAAR